MENLANNNTESGAITFGSAARINSDGGTLTLSTGGLSGNFAKTFGGAGDLAVSGIISGAGDLLCRAYPVDNHHRSGQAIVPHERKVSSDRQTVNRGVRLLNNLPSDA